MKKIGVYILVLFAISLVLLGGCAKDKNLETLKLESENLVCLPSENSSEEEAAGTDITGKVTEEIEKEIPDVLDDEAASEDAASGSETEVQAQDDENVIVKTFIEGENAKLSAKANDKDNDQVTFKYTSPLDENGEWQTKEGDAGTYYVTVTASDGKSELSKKVKLVILPKNQPPTIEIAETISAKEGETFSLEPKVTDPEGEKIIVSYSGWMTTATKELGYNDAGLYFVKITATDGAMSVSKDVKVVVDNVNRAPLINNVPDLVVLEGDKVKVPAKAIDADGDNLTYLYLGAPIDAEGIWQTKIGDAGTYKVSVTASDGIAKDTKEFLLVVKMNNKAPVITIQNEMLFTVNKGETKTIKLEPVVTDGDGDKVTLTYSGWMTSAAKEATYEDGGSHTVTIIADDGKEKTTMDVSIVINRPPEFIIE